MSLTKDNPEVGAIKSISESYDMPIFAVSMIKDFYNTEDPFLVAKLLADVFDIHNLTIEDITQLLYQKLASPKQRFSLCSRDIF